MLSERAWLCSSDQDSTGSFLEGPELILAEALPSPEMPRRRCITGVGAPRVGTGDRI